MTDGQTNRLTDWRNNGRTDRLTDWLTDGLRTDELKEWQTERCLHLQPGIRDLIRSISIWEICNTEKYLAMFFCQEKLTHGSRINYLLLPLKWRRGRGSSLAGRRRLGGWVGINVFGVEIYSRTSLNGPKSNGNLTPTDTTFSPQTSFFFILYIGYNRFWQ